AAKQINQWETFLNGDSDKEKLVSRYLYEHLFQAHLHFEATGAREFYRLVRSATPPGKPVEVIATRRPYGDSKGRIYYRLVRHQGSIVAKTHMVYELSAKRMQRYQELFFEPDYDVASLPSYEPAVASNPIKTFSAIPVKSRYRFLLDEARFFIEGFIKGPVCRGQVALNVIEDQFWVVFFDPDSPIMPLHDDFLNEVSEYLASPAELEDSLRVLSSRKHYRKLFQKYIHTKESLSAEFGPLNIRDAVRYIWNGDGGRNPNAALTVFRHLDSASVNFGFIGDYPETAWVIDYSVLERIHYLLVAGYDVYGNLGHQLNTRLYMDFLRTEGEDYFLVFMPADKRKQIRDAWYQGIRESNKFDEGEARWLKREYVTGYETDTPQLEFYRLLEHYLGPVSGARDYINRCTAEECKPLTNKEVLRVDTAMQKAAKMDGPIVQFLPDLAFVRVMMGGNPDADLAYTMINNKAYKSVSSMFEGEKLGDRRDYEYDTQTVVRWLEGSYPNFFYVVKLDDIERFVEEYNAIANRQDYEAFVARYGLRRTSEDFWMQADWFNDKYAQEEPGRSGIYDLNRYQNR
ncbi:MAG: fatty acid cis/trans isomerase, partial [Gammaproteobacteria bacterium]